MEYKILSSDTAEAMTLAVNTAIRDGWQPLGGLVVTIGAGRLTWVQAITHPVSSYKFPDNGAAKEANNNIDIDRAGLHFTVPGTHA